MATEFTKNLISRGRLLIIAALLFSGCIFTPFKPTPDPVINSLPNTPSSTMSVDTSPSITLPTETPPGFILYFDSEVSLQPITSRNAEHLELLAQIEIYANYSRVNWTSNGQMIMHDQLYDMKNLNSPPTSLSSDFTLNWLYQMHPDGKRFVGLWHDKEGYLTGLWNIETNTMDVQYLSEEDNADLALFGPWGCNAKFSSDGQFLAVIDETSDIVARIWAVENGKEVAVLEWDTLLNALEIDREAREAMFENGEITYEQLQYMELYAGLSCALDFYPGERSIILGHGSGLASGHRLYEWNFETGEITRFVLLSDNEITQGAVYTVSFNSNGTLLASGGIDGQVRLWNVEKRKEIKVLKPEINPDLAPSEYRIADLEFSKDGSILIIGNLDKVRLWDIKTGELLVELEEGEISRDVAFNPEETMIATVGFDNILRLWGIPAE